MNIYENCPTFTTQRFVLRQVRREDAAGLLRVYSDVVAQPYFNSDNRPSDFRYTRLQDMERCIDMWLGAYAQGQLVRWTILDEKRPVGTVELCPMEDSRSVMMRIDVHSHYEFTDVFDEIFEVMLPTIPAMFGRYRVLTKALPYMERRRVSLVLFGFVQMIRPLIGPGGIPYPHYFVKRIVS